MAGLSKRSESVPGVPRTAGTSRRALVLGGGLVLTGFAGMTACSRRAGTDTSDDTANETTDTADDHGPPNPAAKIVFTTTGATFSPLLELAGGSNAELMWLDKAGNELARGPTPELRFDSPAVRKITLKGTLDDVVTVNLGFSSEDDVGRYSLTAEHNKPPEAVAGVSGLSDLRNLRRFLAAHGELAGHLDLSGLSLLEHVECYAAKVQSIDLSECTALQRLCVENMQLSELDLNPVAGTLLDLRAAAQIGGSLNLTALDAPMARLYHFCVRDQVVTGHPTADQLPALEELWNWNSGQGGAMPSPGAARSIAAYGNAYTSADLTGQFTYDEGGGLLELSDNRLASLTLGGCKALQTLRLSGNALSQTAVDGILEEVESWGTAGSELILDGSNAPPSSRGLSLAEELRSRGWTVSLS